MVSPTDASLTIYIYNPAYTARIDQFKYYIILVIQVRSMGNHNSKHLSRHIEEKRLNQKEVNFEFQPCHQQMIMNPNFLNGLLIENFRLVPNIYKFFPNANKDYDEFTQLALFLRQINIKPQRSQFARYNAQKTNLMDRYFMLTEGIQTWEQLEAIQINIEQQQLLMIQLMKIFIRNPKPGFITKLRKFFQIENSPTIKLKVFSGLIKDNFPQIYKHLRDYWTAKFRDMIGEAYLLENFRSAILNQDAAILSMKIPEMAGKQIKLLYSTDQNGLSFHAYERKIIGYDGPWLLLAQSADNQTYKFGSFQTGPIRDIIGYQGDLRGFMFSIDPTIRFMTTDKGENGNHYFFINNIDQKISKKTKGLGFGGDNAKENCKLWIDQDLDKSTVFNGNDKTYGYGLLANPMSQNLNITKMQIWGLGTKFDLEKQAQYWSDREDEALKRRKVNKKELLDGNAGLMFEKTFAHRDQVVGDIDWGKKKQQKQ